MKELTIIEKTNFKLKLRQWKCELPNELNSIEFVQEQINDEGDITTTSTYNFFMTDIELKKLAESLTQ
jgi:hypothetical protein